jgi:hypothetical protein
MPSNQYQPKQRPGPNGGSIVSFYDGETLVFETSEIPQDFKLLGDMIHSTLEVAISFGFVKQPQSENPA